MFVLCLCESLWPRLLPAQGRRDTLRLTETFIPRSFNVSKDNTTETVRLGGLFFASLYGYDKRGRIIPILAQNELVKDIVGRTSYTVQLKPGLRWHGTPMLFNAYDVKFTYEHLKNQQTSAANWPRQVVKEIRVVDDLNVEFIFSRSIFFDLIQDIFTVPIYPRQFANRSEADYFESPIGLGPFMILRRWYDEIILARNTNYALRSPEIPFVKVERTADKSMQFVLLTNLSIDVVPDLLPIYSEAVDNDAKLALQSYNLQEYYYIAYNTRRANLSDKRVRQAFTLVSNRQKMLENVFGGDKKGEVITGPLTPDSPFYNSALPKQAYDKAKADSLLRAAAAEGKFDFSAPLTFKVPIFGPQSPEETICLSFRYRLVELGIKIQDPEVMDFYKWREVIFNKHDFDITFGIWTYGESVNLRALFHSDEIEPGRLNFTGYSATDLDALLDAIYLKTQKPPEELRDMFHRAHAIIYEDCPYTFLFKLTKYAGYNRRVNRVNIQPANFYQNIHEWYLSE